MIEFHVLGTLALVRRDGQEARPLLVRPKQIALLAYLVLHQPRGWQQRNSLLALFWPESDERRARFSLRTALHGLRSELGADAVLARGDDEISINADLVRCDALAFEDALDAHRLEDALSLYRGPLLEGLIVTGIADFQIWADDRRNGLRRRAVTAAVALADEAEAKGNVDDLLRCCRRALELSPHEETLLRRQLRVLEGRGERAEALRVYDLWVERLRTELDSEPSPETVAAAERLRAHASPSPAKGAQRLAPTTKEPAAPLVVVDAARVTPVARPTPTPRFRHMAIGVVIGVAIVALGFAGALGLRRSPSVEPTASGTAVLPFAFSGDPKFATLADGAAALISAGLGDAGPLRSVDPHIVATLVAKQPAGSSQLALGTEAGRRLGVSHFIIGSIVEEQGVLRMQATLYAVGRESAPLGSATASGRADSIFAITDRIVSDLLAARVGGVPTDALGTTSVEALRAYVDGERQLFAARYAGAADSYARAVAADSNFARAYFRLSYAGSLGGHDNLSRAAGARALALKSRLSPNDRLLLDAWLAWLDANIPLSIYLYEKSLNQDERNPEAWLQLAEIRYHWGPMLGIPPASAVAAFKHVMAMVPDNGAALIHLARIEARDAPHGGGFDTLAAAARKLNLAATEDLELRTLAAILSGRSRARDSVLAEAAARGAVTERQLLLMAIQFADTVVSTRLARSLIRSGSNDGMRVTGHVELAQIEASHGRMRAALQSADSLAAIAPDRAAELRAWILCLPFVKTDASELLRARDALSRTREITPPIGPSVSHIANPMIYPPRRRYLEAVLSLLAGDTATAAMLSHELATWPRANQQDSAFAGDYAQAINAEMLMRTSPAQAPEAFSPPHTEPDKTYPDLMSFFAARERYLRAEALAAAGHTTEAIAWLETFPDPAGYDMWFMGPVLLRRAQLYASAGRTQDSRQAYERFVALWQAADADFAPVVKQARDALARTR